MQLGHGNPLVYSPFDNEQFASGDQVPQGAKPEPERFGCLSLGEEERGHDSPITVASDTLSMS